jgi:hypothetical protein
VKLELNPQIKAVNKSLYKKYSSFVLIFSVVLSICCITVITLMYSTKQVTKGYVINSLDKENQKLLRELEVLNMNLNEKRALKNISSSDKISKMRNPSRIVYVNSESSIAKR